MRYYDIFIKFYFPGLIRHVRAVRIITGIHPYDNNLE